LRDGADPEGYQLGLSSTAQETNPTQPVDDELDLSDAPSVADD